MLSTTAPMALIDNIRDKLKRRPEIRFEAIPGGILVPATAVDGFPVSIQLHGRGHTVSFAGWHEEFSIENDALDCFGFGLSDACRLAVQSRGSFDYRWTTQYWQDGAWHSDSETVRFLFPFWRPRTERFLQNHYLRRRLDE